MKLLIIPAIFFIVSCSSSDESSDSSGYDRAGRPIREPKVMNNKSLDTESIYQRCIKESPEIYCRNRMGR